jgi:signal transduction histidine kinase
MLHELKTWPEAFEAVRRGEKTHEARRADRPFAVGDVLRLREWRPDHPELCQWDATPGLTGSYTGRVLDVEVTHITRGMYGLPSGIAIMSIRLPPAPVPADRVTAEELAEVARLADLYEHRVESTTIVDDAEKAMRVLRALGPRLVPLLAAEVTTLRAALATARAERSREVDEQRDDAENEALHLRTELDAIAGRLESLREKARAVGKAARNDTREERASAPLREAIAVMLAEVDKP